MEDHHNHQQIAHLAYQFWLERGCPVGSSGEDWFRAERALQSGRAENVEADAGKGGPVQIAADITQSNDAQPMLIARTTVSKRAPKTALKGR